MRYLLLLFFLVLITRVYIAYETNNYTPDAYSEIRQIEHITKHGTHIINDELSFGGRSRIVLPLFHYILGFSATLLPLNFVLKFFPNLFISSLVFFIFLIVKYLTNNFKAALFTAFVGGFTPLLFLETVNSVSPFSLLVPLIFLFLYSFMRLNNNKYVKIFIILSFILPLISLSSLVLVFTFLLYLMFAKLENFEFKGRAKELTILFSFFTIWFILVVFKKAFLQYGPNIIRSTIPSALQNNYFQDLTFGKLFGGIGLLSLAIASYTIYISLFEHKNRNVYLLFSFILTLLVFMWLNLLKASLALALIAVSFSVFVGLFYSSFFLYLRNTKLIRFKTYILAGIIFLFFLNSVVFSLILGFDSGFVTDSEIRALEWANKNTPPETTIVAPLKFGNLVTYVAKRKNIADSNFLLALDSEERFNDLDIIYSTNSVFKAVNAMEKWDAKFILFSEGLSPNYINNKECFSLVYNQNVRIYKRVCEVVSQ